MRKFIETTSMITVCFGLIFMIILWFWYLYPYNPLEVKEPLEILNENKTVKAGELLIYRVSFKKNTPKLPVINRYLIDGLVYALPPVYPVNLQGKHTQTVSSITIPLSLPAGNYILRSVATYEMNPIRKVDVMYETEKFIVVK